LLALVSAGVDASIIANQAAAEKSAIPLIQVLREIVGCEDM
jgi:hypothetical protein